MITIRLKRLGKKHRPFYRIVVTNVRSKRDGRVIDEIGYYDPFKETDKIKLDREKFEEWVKKGSTVSETVKNLIKRVG